MKALKFAAVALVLATTSVSAQQAAKDTGKAAKKALATAAKQDAKDAHKEAKAAEKTADKAMVMAADAKKDAKVANKEAHEAMGEKSVATTKKHSKKGGAGHDTTAAKKP